MKVLTIKEPFASLIKEGIKTYEIRTWKTNYRGELYIHSSKAKVKGNDREKLLIKKLKNKEFIYGHILFKCNLVDCIYIDDAFLKKMQKNSSSNIYLNDSIGSYAWELKDIEILEKTIPVKGQLSIWNYSVNASDN